MSTDRQEDSIERQQSQVVPYVKQRGYHVVGEYRDEGIAGDVFERRAGFQQLLRDAKSGKFEVIVSDEPSRLSRQKIIKFIATVVDPLDEAGVTLDTVTDGPQGWDDVVDVIRLAIRQDKSSEEPKKLSHRVISRMIELAKEGRPLGGKAPYGLRWRLGSEVVGGREVQRPLGLMPGDPREVQAVLLMFHLVGDRGFTLQMVSRELYERGIPNPRGGKFWNKTTIRAILGNRKYLGDMPWNGQTKGKYSRVVAGRVEGVRRKAKRKSSPTDWVVVPDRHEAIIARDLFDRVQARIAANRKRTGPAGAAGGHLLSGLLVCGSCGARMIGHGPKGDRFYHCGSYHQQVRHACFYNRVRETGVLGAIVGKLQEVILNPENLERLRDEVRRQEEAERQERPGRQAELERQLKELAQKIQKATDRLLFVEADLMPECATALRGLKEERDRLTAELEALRKPTTARAEVEEVIQTVEQQMKRLREAVVESDPSLVRAVLQDMVSKVELHFEQVPRGKRTSSRFTRGVIYLRTLGANEQSPSLSSTASRRG
jgi:DNA invertase Pin-like site-specific DNA recombinase